MSLSSSPSVDASFFTRTPLPFLTSGTTRVGGGGRSEIDNKDMLDVFVDAGDEIGDL